MPIWVPWENPIPELEETSKIFLREKIKLFWKILNTQENNFKDEIIKETSWKSWKEIMSIILSELNKPIEEQEKSSIFTNSYSKTSILASIISNNDLVDFLEEQQNIYISEIAEKLIWLFKVWDSKYEICKWYISNFNIYKTKKLIWIIKFHAE